MDDDLRDLLERVLADIARSADDVLAEIAAYACPTVCEPYLISQIELIKPKLIVALGKVAAQNLLKCDDSISSLRGKVHHFSSIPLIVTYHPAYLLRSLPEKAKAWKDLCFANATMQSLK